MTPTPSRHRHHHAGCRFVSYGEVLARVFGEESGVTDNYPDSFLEECGVMDCHADCLVRARAAALGRQLASEYGW